MRIKLFSVTLSALLALANANQYTFNVVSIKGEGYSMGVKINNQISNLAANYFPLFSGVVNANNVDKYKYVVLDNTGAVVEEESFERSYSDKTANINEVYNRTNKDVEIQPLPEPLGNDYPMGTDKFKPLPKNEIYNIYAKCDEAQYNNRKNQPFLADEVRNDELVNCTITIISRENIYQSTGTIRLSGYGSRLFKKLSWLFKFDKKFMGRNSVKIRGVANDATLMRDKISADIYKAMGIPVQEGTYARVTINNDVWGLFTIVDSINKKWIKNYIHGNNNAHFGTSYKLVSSHPTGPWADLRYIGDNFETYASTGSYNIDEIDTADPEANVAVPGNEWNRLIKFTKLYDDWVKKYQNDNSNAAVEALEQFFDVELALRVLAVDALTLAIDNFWFVRSNAVLYYNPESSKYQILPYDFDESMKGYSEYFDFQSMKEDCLTWADNATTGCDQYFTKSLLANQQIKKRYDIVLAAASRKLFTVDILSKYIDSISQLINEDVEWNFSLGDNYDSTYNGMVNKYTKQNFDDATNTGKVPYEENVIFDEVVYGLKDYIKIRGDGCRAYTKDVVIPSSASRMTINITLLFVLSQLIIFLVF